MSHSGHGPPETGAVLLADDLAGFRGGWARAIRGLDPSVRGILCGAYEAEVLCRTAREHGFLGFLKKPFSLQDLDAYLQAAGLNGGPGGP